MREWASQRRHESEVDNSKRREHDGGTDNGMQRGRFDAEAPADERGRERRGPEPQQAADAHLGPPDAAVECVPEQRELAPAGNAGRRGQACRTPLRVDPETWRHHEREDIAERRHEHDPDDGKAQRRSRIAHRVVSGRVEPRHGRRQQSDRRAGENTPDVHGVLGAESAVLQDRGGNHVAKDQEHGGRRYDEKGNALERGPRRARSASARARSSPATPDIAGNSAAETEIPKRLTGSV